MLAEKTDYSLEAHVLHVCMCDVVPTCFCQSDVCDCNQTYLYFVMDNVLATKFHPS